MSDITNSCKNCNNNYNGNFCNICGQSSHTQKINFQYVLHEIQHSILHVDSGIFYTIKELFLRPGNSIREFIEGKRIKHFKPAAFVIILSLIYSFLEHKIDKITFIEDGLLGIVEGANYDDNHNDKEYKIFEWFIHHYSYTVLFLIPVFSLASFLAFKKSKYNYFEHLVLNNFLFGQITLIFILTIPLSLIFSNNYNVEIIRIVLAVIFAFWAYFQFFNSIRKFARILNTVLTYTIFIFFTAILTFILVGISIA